ncbi:MAG: SpoIID/LytB domain-containing protein [Patescibacteria group bacterium]
MYTAKIIGRITALTFLASIFFVSNPPAIASLSLPQALRAGTALADPTSFFGRELIPEPTIRVGLYKTNEPIKFVSDFSYEVWSGDSSRAVIAAGVTTTLSYKNGIYTLKSDNLEFGLSDYLRLIPQDQSNFFTLANYNRPVKGRGKINFNVYRGALEYRYSPKSKQTYIINELFLDSYVAGVAETHDSAPIEYIKALMVAARSYAYSHISKNSPTEKRMFDVYPTTVDQIYLGYNSELFMSRVAKAAADTAGEMVTYSGNPVPTPYFSHSNGHTKNWKTKDRPWLKSVPAIYDKGKKMYGHGMGMSNNDAIKRALKDGWIYSQILQYYYTSTTVEKVY